MVDHVVQDFEDDHIFDQEQLDDSDYEEEDHGHENETRQFKCLTESQRQNIYKALLEKSSNGKMKRNTTAIVAEKFQVNRQAVQRVWKRAKKCRENGIPDDVSSKKSKNCGRKRLQADLSQITSVPLHKRSTIRSLSESIGVNKSTLHRWFKDGQIRRHSNSLKPLLKQANKEERLRWCISMLDPHTLPNDPKFIEMRNIIHSDEKWFNATRKDKKFYLLPEDEDPHKIVQNKNSIQKIMFLSLVTLPWFDDVGNCTFDGKIGIWPFVKKVLCQIFVELCLFHWSDSFNLCM